MITLEQWAGARSAAHGHVTGAHLGDEFWRAQVAPAELVNRWASLPLDAVLFLAGRRAQ